MRAVRFGGPTSHPGFPSLSPSTPPPHHEVLRRRPPPPPGSTPLLQASAAHPLGLWWRHASPGSAAPRADTRPPPALYGSGSSFGLCGAGAAWAARSSRPVWAVEVSDFRPPAGVACPPRCFSSPPGGGWDADSHSGAYGTLPLSLMGPRQGLQLREY